MSKRLWLSAVVLSVSAGCASSPDPDRAQRPAPAVSSQELFNGVTLPAPTGTRAATGAPGPEYWQQGCDYHIEASLDEDTNRITGRETITYTNNSPDALSELWLNLEQNLFAKGSQAARKIGGGQRFGNRDGFKGGYTIKSVRTADGTPLKLEVHDTVGRIGLPAAMPPHGGSMAIAIEWSFTLPPYGSDRLGIDKSRNGEIFQVAQWFPSLCTYDDVYGWNTLPYHGQGEFYTNIGSFDVSITVPATHIVAATGVLQNEDQVLTPVERERLSRARSQGKSVLIRTADETDAGQRGGGVAAAKSTSTRTATWRFKAERIRTFAWASSAAFVWDAAFCPGSGVGSDGEPGRGQGTLCQSFYPREASRVWGPESLGGGSTQMLIASLNHYGKMWYAYPYPSAANVNGVVGGMEYPMIIFCGGGRAVPNANGEVPGAKDAERGLWGVTTHEIGHNWFPMLINTDERRHAWMDEGFNTFINYYAGLERYPDLLPARGNPRVWSRDNPNPMPQMIDIPADDVRPGYLGTLQYGKTSVGLVWLRETILGPEVFDRAFREYIRRWAFRSPRPWDFFRTMEHVSGRDLGWFWRQWFYETGVLDQAVARVQPGQEATEIVFENREQLVAPLTFKVVYSDQTEEVRSLDVGVWRDGNSVSERIPTVGRSVAKVVVDPNEDLPDVDPKNNVWPK